MLACRRTKRAESLPEPTGFDFLGSLDAALQPPDPISNTLAPGRSCACSIIRAWMNAALIEEMVAPCSSRFTGGAQSKAYASSNDVSAGMNACLGTFRNAASTTADVTLPSSRSLSARASRNFVA